VELRSGTDILTCRIWAALRSDDMYCGTNLDIHRLSVAYRFFFAFYTVSFWLEMECRIFAEFHFLDLWVNLYVIVLFEQFSTAVAL
jgi:hypothetical protein